MSEPKLTYCTVREGDAEWHIECRFSDGQKFAAITVDGEFPSLADLVAGSLNAQVWTDERPTEPGEYWLSMPPPKRSRHGEWKAAVFAVRLINECSLLQASHALSTGTPVPVNLVIRWLSGSANRRGPCVKSSELDGAKWSRRETPADPFEVTK